MSLLSVAEAMADGGFPMTCRAYSSGMMASEHGTVALGLGVSGSRTSVVEIFTENPAGAEPAFSRRADSVAE